uniref:Uncharacterized protein n=1 Tax=Ciona intestinalis TaxID=7719 RepID=H2Y118_CIOIN
MTHTPTVYSLGLDAATIVSNTILHLLSLPCHAEKEKWLYKSMTIVTLSSVALRNNCL